MLGFIAKAVGFGILFAYGWCAARWIAPRILKLLFLPFAALPTGEEMLSTMLVSIVLGIGAARELSSAP